MITQIGISMIVPIFLGAFIGYQLDRLFGTGFLFLVFLLLGILAAFRNIYKLTKPFYAEDLKREEKEQAYWDSLKKERLHRQQAEEGPEIHAHAAPQSGVAARRERMQLSEERKQQETGFTVPKSRREAAEEAFAAWREERERSHDGTVSNGRENCHDREISHDRKEDSGEHGDA